MTADPVAEHQTRQAHLTRVRARVAIHAHRKVRGLLEGEYAATQTGRSMDFNDLREYVRGDDVKDIDWLATARTGHPLVKRYVAVRKHTVLLVAVTGRSMAALNDWGVAKRDLAVLVAGVVGDLAVRHGDQVALVHGDAEGVRALPPGSGEVHLERCLAATYDACTADAAPADLIGVLSHVARTVRRRCILLVVTDEVCPDERPAAEALAGRLRRLGVQHEVLVAGIGDLDPTLVPGTADEGPLLDVDSGTALPSWVAGDPSLQAEYADAVRADTDRMRRLVERTGAVFEQVHDSPSAVRGVLRLLERHRHARR